MKVSILSLATAVPAFAIEQEDVSDKFIEMLSLDSHQASTIRKIHQNSAIQTRYSVIQDFKKECKQQSFWGADFPKKVPGIKKRNDLYKLEAPKLACEAAFKALDKWQGNAKDITHVIAISCTGMMAPGIEFDIMRHLNLNSHIERLAINFMGCFGAFKGLSVAQSLAKESPLHRILVVCVELCSLHFQVEQTPDNVLGNSLFSDGAAAVIIGANPKEKEVSLWEIVSKRSFVLDNTREKMMWEAGDNSFIMTLSHTVPVFIKREIGMFVQLLLGKDFSYSDCDWAIHPGGKSIIQAIEIALNLKKEWVQASWDTLANYGNMSSATFLFVLNSLLEQRIHKKWTVGLGFGPGLSVEGVLLKRPEKNAIL